MALVSTATRCKRFRSAYGSRRWRTVATLAPLWPRPQQLPEPSPLPPEPRVSARRAGPRPRSTSSPNRACRRWRWNHLPAASASPRAASTGISLRVTHCSSPRSSCGSGWKRRRFSASWKRSPTRVSACVRCSRWWRASTRPTSSIPNCSRRWIIPPCNLLSAAFPSAGWTTSPRRFARNRARLAYSAYVGFLQLNLQLKQTRMQHDEFDNYVEHMMTTLIPPTN